MLTTLIIIVLLLVLLGAVGFAPYPAFTTGQRISVGTILLIFFLVWLFRYSHLVLF